MSKNNPLCTLTLAGILLLASCAKEGPNGPTGPVGPSGPPFTGIITGHLFAYDQYGSRLYTGLSNAQLTLKGGLMASTDSLGQYTFDSVGTGNYNITATATGYGSTVLNNLNFVKDTLFADIKVSALPTFNLTTFKAYHNTGSPYDSLVATFDADTRIRNCIFFVSNTANVGNLPANYLLAYTKSMPANATAALLRIPATDLNYVNIFYGEKTYFAACSYVVGDASVYEDVATGKNVYTAIGTALVDSAVAP